MLSHTDPTQVVEPNLGRIGDGPDGAAQGNQRVAIKVLKYESQSSGCAASHSQRLSASPLIAALVETSLLVSVYTGTTMQSAAAGLTLGRRVGPASGPSPVGC